jgi:myxalamid-type polyketide synthase MxaB
VNIDLDPACPEDEVETLYELLRHRNEETQEETQIALRHQERFVSRLVHSRRPPGGGSQPLNGQPYRLDTSARGILDNLEFRPMVRREPGPHEVEIEVYATGLGFRDVLNALDMYPGGAKFFGSECAGRITAAGEMVMDFQVGDDVIAMAVDSFSSFVTVSAHYIVHKPDHLSFAEAATIPSAFVTAFHGLQRLGRITAGDRVLIHAAAGGVGLAAVQLAQRAGAEIFATAGNPEKRAYLKSLGVQHVFDSRSLDFAAEIMAITKGEGVDLVLNSLSGDFIDKSIEVLAESGTFVEIGKRGIWSAEEVAVVKPKATYFVVDLMAEGEEKPELVGSILSDMIAKFNEGTLRPLPLRVFSAKQVVDAFRYMARAEHLGKIVVAQKPESDAGQAFKIHADATYLITGGLGGLGLAVARWLVEQGARHLVLVSRRAPSEEAQEVISALEQAGAQVVIAAVDIAEAEEMGRLFTQIDSSLPPLRGVIQSAGVLEDGALIQQEWDRFVKVFRPKMQGSWNLHTLTCNRPLDFFVLFSSAVALLGSPGQANHAAANTFQDALAHYRHAHGLPALTINWGAWSEVGAAAERRVEERMMQRGGVYMSPQEGIEAFEYAMARANQAVGERQTQIGIVALDWSKQVERWVDGAPPPFYREIAWEVPAMNGESVATSQAAEDENDTMQRLGEAAPAERQSILLEYVRLQALRVLDLDPAHPLDRRQKLQEVGLDSLMAVELRNRVGTGLALKRKLPATLLFDYPTVEALTAFLIQELAFDQVGQTDSPLATLADRDRAAEEALAELEQLTDEEAEALLFEELRNTQEGNYL